MKRPLLASAAFGLIAAGAGAAAQHDAPPLRQPTTIEDVMPPPANLRGFAAVADAVVVVDFTDNCRSVTLYPGPTTLPSDYLACGATLVEAIKRGEHLPDVGGHLTVLRAGSASIQNGRVVRSSNPRFPDFEAGQRFVLFLHWSTSGRNYMNMYAQEGALQIVSGVVQTSGLSPFASSQRGRDAAAVIDDLRSAVASVKK